MRPSVFSPDASLPPICSRTAARDNSAGRASTFSPAGANGAFQPMNINFGLFPEPPARTRGKDRKRAQSERARRSGRLAGRSEIRRRMIRCAGKAPRRQRHLFAMLRHVAGIFQRVKGLAQRAFQIDRHERDQAMPAGARVEHAIFAPPPNARAPSARLHDSGFTFRSKFPVMICDGESHPASGLCGGSRPCAAPRNGSADETGHGVGDAGFAPPHHIRRRHRECAWPSG